MPRITIKRLMMVIACVALALVTAQRVRNSRFWAMMHRNTEASMRADLAVTEGHIFRCKDPATVLARWKRSGADLGDLALFVRDDTNLKRRAATLRKMAAHHAEIGRRYDWACRFPWQNVRVDPGPEW
jgi:hypothetical protein